MDDFAAYDAINQILRGERESRWIVAGNKILEMQGYEQKFNTVLDAQKYVEEHFYFLLNSDMYLEAAVLIWGIDKFDPRPLCVQRMHKAIIGNSRLLVQGGSGLGKSYYCIIFCLLDWVRDPEYTAIRFASMSREHLQKNVFTHLLEMHTASVIPLPGSNSKDLFLGLYPNSGNSCITGIAFPKDEKTTGRFLGFKPYARKRGEVHERFGKMSRVRVFLEEFNKMSPGVMGDLNSVEAAISGTDIVKIMAAYNPADPTHIAHAVSEPQNGWDSVDPERDYEWDTKWKWHLIRLDGLQSENVVQRKNLYQGFLTWEAFNGYLSKGDSSADYWTYGRGWWPVSGAYNTIFARDILQESRRTPIYLADVVEVGAVDTALINDSTVYTKARYGPAIGFYGKDGQKNLFPDGVKYILFAESQIKIPGARDEWELAQKIRDVSRQLGVTPQWLCMDKTGNGSGIYNALHRIFGDILGIGWAEKATEKRLLADDIDTADKSYTTQASEMWFCAAKWVQCGILYISPNIPDSPLFDQLTSRRRRDSKSDAGKLQVESKAEYRARGHDKSPDEADSCIMLTQLIRMRHSVLPGSGRDDTQEVLAPVRQSHWDKLQGGKQPEVSAPNTVDDQVSLDEIGEMGFGEQTGQMEDDEEEAQEVSSW